MESPAERLIIARERAGYASAADAAQALRIPHPTYFAHENGSRGLARSAQKYADFFGVSMDWLVRGKGPGPAGKGRATNIVTVRGYIGAGAAVHIVDDGPYDEIEAPFRCGPDCAAVRVRGDSMRPMMEEGDILVYDEQTEDAATMLNKRCVVKLQDGRIFVKKLRRGTAPGLYSLESFNADLIEDVAVEWVAKIMAIMPR